MKKTKYIGMAAAMVAAAMPMQQVLAADGTGPSGIAGSISFIGSATTDGGNIADATEFTSITARVLSDSGDYDLVPSLQGPTPGVTTLTSKGVVDVMSDYSFNPSQGSVTPLWKFTTGGVTYSFDATTLNAFFNSSADAWNISGNGVALISGGGTDYNPTPGTWSATVSGNKTSFNFGSSEDPPAPNAAPDGASTIALLGGAFSGLQIIRRKLS